MQDGEAIPAETAGAWLGEHFKDDPEPTVSIEWTARTERDDAGFSRLLNVLFTPLTDGPEA